MPRFHYAAMTWGIPPDYGGVTRVLLDRADLMAEQLGQEVPVITLEGGVDLDALSARLATSGALGERVRLRNPWFELARMTDRELAGFAALAPIARHGGQALEPLATESRTALRHTLSDEVRGLRLINHLRPDGTVFLRDERGLHAEGGVRPGWGPGGLVLVDHQGTDVARWGLARDFYFSWIDHVLGTRRSVIVCDSKYVGSFLHAYRRPHVRTIQVLHSAHLPRTPTSPCGPFRRSKSEILLHHERFDTLAFLTERQATDFAEAFTCRPRTVVIPDRIELAGEDLDVTVRREPGVGVMAARLVPGKQVDHAIRALARVSSESGTRLELDIYGSGPQTAHLERLIQELGLSHQVCLRGYDPAVATQFERASFTLLTSQSEGQGLVLGEAMSRGCVPISYDIDYGPSEIITHGVDGLLVPPDDVDALAAAIHRFITMDEQQRVRMRVAGRRRASDFAADPILARWSRACIEALERPNDWVRVGSGALVDTVTVQTCAGVPCLVLRGGVRAVPSDRGHPLRLLCSSRDRRFGCDLSVEAGSGASDPDPSRFRVAVPLERMPLAGRVYDFWITGHGPGPRLRLALPERIELPTVTGRTGTRTAYETVLGHLSVRCARASHG